MDTRAVHPVKLARLSRKLTQKQLAELCGIAQPNLSTLEKTDITSISTGTLQRIANALDMELILVSGKLTFIPKEK